MVAAGADVAAATSALLAELLPQPLDHVLLQADLTAVAPGPLESDLARELALTADIESTGGATVFRFSDSSIRRALDSGRSAADLHTLLAARSRTPVPQPLTYLIDDVARRHGRIRIGLAGSYVRCDDDGLLNEVLADRRVESLRLRRLAPSVLVSPLTPERVAERLREVGYAPAAESPDGALLLRRPDAGRAPARPRPLRRRPELAAPAAGVVTVAVKAIRGGDRAVTTSRGMVVGGSVSDVVPHSASSETLAVLQDAVTNGPGRLDRLPERPGAGEQSHHRAAAVGGWVLDRVRLPTRRAADVRGAPHHRGRRTDRCRGAGRQRRRRVDTWDNGPVTDGPLIVQSDKTLLLEVDHELAAECRRAIAPVRGARAVARARAHLPADPAWPVECARRRARCRRSRRRAAEVQPLRGAARAADRRRRDDGPLRPAAAHERSRARPRAAFGRSGGARRSAAQPEGRADDRRPARRRRGGHSPERARPPQAGLAQARLAGRRPRRLRRRRGARDLPAARTVGRSGRTNSRRSRASGTAVLVLSCCRVVRARRSSALPRWPRTGDHVDPGDEHRRGSPVAARTAQAHVTD